MQGIYAWQLYYGWGAGLHLNRLVEQFSGYVVEVRYLAIGLISLVVLNRSINGTRALAEQDADYCCVHLDFAIYNHPPVDLTRGR